MTTSAGGWHPPLWLGLLCIPVGLLAFFIGLHLLNGWGWVCRVWSELMFRVPAPAPAPAATLPPPTAPGAIAPLVSVSAAPPQPPATADVAGAHETESN